MSMPTQPANLLPRPFAADGTYQLIPDTQTASGRASFALGFPPETQRPLNEGGVAPNRTDINGMFYMLSAFAYWQQSGGMWNYVTTLNYTAPAVVYHNNTLWWCVGPNGPDVDGVGAKEPGADTDYWIEFIRALSGGGSGSLGNPVGTVIMFYGTTAPSGYFLCNGSAFNRTENPELFSILGSANTPDLRGYFIRGYDTRNTIDPSGASRAIGSDQQDAGREIDCWIDVQTNSSGDSGGALHAIRDEPDGCVARNMGNGLNKIGFTASRSWGASHTATEFRPRNKTLLFCIKHD